MNLPGAQKLLRCAGAMLLAGAVSTGCGLLETKSDEVPFPERTGSETLSPPVAYEPDEPGQSIVGDLKESLDELNPFSDSKDDEQVSVLNEAVGAGSGAGIGVNSYLWKASLDTIAFMPLSSADPFGGVIITDWYTPDGASYERFKMNVFILVRALRADGIRVSVFRQVLDSSGAWRDAPVPVQTASRIEDAILTRARQLRSETLRRPE